MSGEESPFFRKYSPGTPLVSPFFAEGGVQPTRFQKSAVDSPIAKSPAKKGKYRQSLPLVYTEFRSPEAAILHKRDPRPSGAQENDQLQDPVHNNSVATSQEVVTRHSFVAAVENMGSNSVWLVLLLPTITSLIFYCLTMDWRYVTFVTPIEYSTILQVPYRLPVADYQLSFLRSLVIVDKYQCPQSTCEEYQMTISADLHTKSTSASSEPGPENLLYTSFPLASYILEYYALMNNESGHYNYSVLIPLPMLHSDTPLFSRSPTRYATILARFGKEGEQSAVVEPAPSSLAGNANNEIVEESKEQYRSSGTAGQSLGAAWRWAAVPTTAESKSKFAGSVSITTFSEAYILFVAILQLFLSAGTLTCLVHMVRATYSSARKLQEKFSFVRTELKVECEDTGYGYGSVEKSEIAETANPEVRVWQFILPEQYTAIALLAFLCAWQGGLPACCVLLSAAGCTINTTTLFICGLIVSLAQFGLLFSLVLYINGLKFHSSAHSAPQSSSYGTTLDSSANNKRLSSARNSYEPFAVQHESHSPDTKSNTEEIDYWRRGSLGLQGAMYGKYARPAHELTPLEREHRRALSLFVTHHHPCSIEFLGFAYRKLVLLFLTWVVVVLYWLLMYPRLWHSKELSDMQVQNVQFRFRVLDVLVLLLSAAWGYYLAQVTVATGIQLRRTKLIISRFRQIAFRTLCYQMQLGAFFLFLISAWYVWTHDFFQDVHFTSSAALVSYVFIWCEYYGLFRPVALSNPALSVHNLELLCFTSSVVLSIAYCMMPPTEELDPQKLKLQSFVALERNLPSTGANQFDTSGPDRKELRERGVISSKLRQYLLDDNYRKFMGLYLPRALQRRDPQYFCLETALVLLEVSYQTYFSVAPSAPTTRSIQSASAALSLSSSTRTTAQAGKSSLDTRRASLNPFDDEWEEEEEREVIAEDIEEAKEPSDIEGLNYGPKLDLRGLGMHFRTSFECEKFTTFGFICESEADGKLVISFRGSLLGNAVANMKFAQVTLPSLKRSRGYFTSILRGNCPAASGIGIGGPRLSNGSGDSEGNHSDGVDSIIGGGGGGGDTAEGGFLAHSTGDSSNDMLEIPAVASSAAAAAAATDDYSYLMQRMEAADNEDDENFNPPPSSAAHSLEDTKIAKKLKSVGSAIPILNQGFKRVHAGFWESYSSIREEYLEAVVLALYEFWQRSIKHAQSATNLSPMNSLNAQTFQKEVDRYQQQTAASESGSLPNAIHALFTSPLASKNPFSPLFSAPPATAAAASAQEQGRSSNSRASPFPTDAADTEPLPIDVKFCGHSLGAAIASLAAFELAENLKVILEAFAMEDCFNVAKSHAVMKLPTIVACPAPKLSLYMFGSPRVGNRQFATAIARKIDNIYRIQVNGDVVTMMPKFVGFYRHIGTAVIVDEEESGSIIIEPSIIESSILQKSTGSVANHSLDKYRSCLEACFEEAEIAEYLSREYRNLSRTREAEKRGSACGGGGGINFTGGLHDIPEWMSGELCRKRRGVPMLTILDYR